MTKTEKKRSEVILSIYPNHKGFGYAIINNVKETLSDDKEHRSKEILSRMGLREDIFLYSKHLSGGMAQRTALARALVNDPELLLLDEPLGSLDAITRWQVREYLSKISKEGEKTVVMVTHDLQEAMLMSDKIVILGGTPSSVIDIIDTKSLKGLDINSERFAKTFIQLKNHLTDEY